MDRGTYGYYKNYNKKHAIISGILLICILAIVIFCVVKYKTTSNVYIVPAVILAIPFAKFFVSLLLGIKYKSISTEDKDKIENNFADNEEVKILYDMTISARDIVTGAPVIIIYDGNIHYISYGSNTEKHRDTQKAVLYDVIEDAGYKDECDVTVYNNVDNLIKGVNKTIKDESRFNATRSIVERIVILCLT